LRGPRRAAQRVRWAIDVLQQRLTDTQPTPTRKAS
jgi:hypothetical protein